MKNFKFVVLILILGVLLSGCDVSNDLPELPELGIPSISKSPEPVGSQGPVTSTTQVSYITNIPELDNSFTLYLSNSVTDKYDNKMGEYLTQLMKEQGFDIDVKFFKIDYRNRSTSMEKWKETIREEIDNGGNLVFEVLTDIDDMDADGLLYYQDKDADDPLISLGGKKRLSFTGVYIQKDLEDEYGESINSIDEYRLFLDWATENAGALTPCMIQLDSGAETFTPISIFAQEHGFIRIDRAIGELGENNQTLYIELADIETSDEVMPVLYQSADLPFFEEMDRVLEEWHRKEYVDIKKRGDEYDLSDYASFILNVRDTSNYYSYDYNSKSWSLKDASDFNLHIFTGETGHMQNPLISDYKSSSQFAISANSPSPEIMLEFFQWIYDTIDNYMCFMCGKEGVDYKYNDGRLEFLENELGISYAQWYKHTIFVEQHAGLVMPQFPANWEDIGRTFKDINYTSMHRVIGEENITIDFEELVYETVFRKELQDAYWAEIKPMYDTYFNGFKYGDRPYALQDLRNDIQESKTALKKKEAYEELIMALCGL